MKREERINDQLVRLRRIVNDLNSLKDYDDLATLKVALFEDFSKMTIILLGSPNARHGLVREIEELINDYKVLAVGHYEARLKIKKLSGRLEVDSKTNLLTAERFMQSLVALLSSPRRRSSEAQDITGKDFVLIAMDMRKFKKINTHCGLEGGDIAIREIASLIREHFRTGLCKEDLQCRTNKKGDEFMVFAGPFSNKNQIVHVVERFRAAVRKHPWSHILKTRDGKDFYGKVDVDLGVTTWNGSFHPQKPKRVRGYLREIIKEACESVSRAKESSRVGTVIYQIGAVDQDGFHSIDRYTAKQFENVKDG